MSSLHRHLQLIKMLSSNKRIWFDIKQSRIFSLSKDMKTIAFIAFAFLIIETSNGSIWKRVICLEFFDLVCCLLSRCIFVMKTDCTLNIRVLDVVAFVYILCTYECHMQLWLPHFHGNENTARTDKSYLLQEN